MSQSAIAGGGLSRRRRHLKFTTDIERLCREDPGARTALRSGLRRGLDEVPRMHRIVAGRIPSGLNEEGQRAYYTVAALIASQPRSDFVEPDPSEEDPEPPTTDGRRFGGSLGTLFAEAVAVAPGRERQMRDSTAERRLNLLTRQSVDGLHRHLPASIRYLREIGVTVDWAELLDDVLAWPVHSGRITRRWLQDYYRLRAKAEAEEAQRADREELESSPRGPE